MSFSDSQGGSAAPPPGSTRPAGPARRGPLLPTLAILLMLGSVTGAVVNAWTEVLWFGQLGYLSVFQTRIVTQAGLFALGALVMASVVGANMWLAFRNRPVYPPSDSDPDLASMERYRAALEPLRRVLAYLVPALLGLFAGSAFSAQWMSVLTWWNRTSFRTEGNGGVDPEFGHDIGFYVFTVPLLQFVVGFLFAVLTLAAVTSAVVHYVYGGLRLSGPGPRTSLTARWQLAMLIAGVLVLRAGSYWLDRYALLSDDTGLFTGAGYTDVTAMMPAKAILAGIAVMMAGVFVASVFTGGWRLPTVGVALMVLSAILVGGLYPWAIQRFFVAPSQQTREQEFLQRNIDSTRAAYGVTDTEVIPYTTDPTATTGALREDALTAASIRLMDPAIISPAFQQMQRGRMYYSFPDSLDIGQYTVDGKPQDAVVAVRELDLDGLQAGQRSWVNDHAVFTHGFGFVAAYGNRATSGGEPEYFEKDIPPQGDLGDFEPRIYFGEKSPTFSIVGAPEGADQRELDYPIGFSAGDAEADESEMNPSGQRNTTFSGDGGPSVGSFVNKALYAIKFRDQNILLSDTVTSQSQILYDRTPRERVAKVAPWLTLDGDPYPAVVAGRIKWIVDGYTVTDRYPYSDKQSLEDVTTDELTQRSSAVTALQQRRVNYIRNSVKATVDAYDGSVDLYAWDEQDPLLQTWMKVFPGTVKPTADISPELMAHLRYPEDLFKVQRTILGKYHVQDANSFYSGQDFWKIPAEPTRGQEGAGLSQPPYYLTLRMPGQDEPSFSLTSAFIPNSSSSAEASVLTGFMAVDADAGDEGGVKAPGYGKIRVLKLPSNATVKGPGQAQNDFNSDADASETLNILSRGDSSVLRGNLLTLPIGERLLYVQPVYVKSKGETSIPLLRKVLVLFESQVGFADTLDEALDQVFGGDSGVQTGDAGTGGDTPDVPVDPENPDAPTTPSGPGNTPSPGLRAALEDAKQAIADGQEALKNSDFAAYGEAQQRLSEALERALAEEEKQAQAEAEAEDQEAGSSDSAEGA